ncbi:PD-(D/E)XK nuclease family protein [uncultured Jannaschia sp.]|uniref:PD-(D/E)XK nuclease family protein n=1 Tax=uncultured Jannaschia sp. TaxID=293347 RepID=UPI002626CE71|nr:PD-(D/E)XK nuclease family protein [uncultured Jannaschia sp.]
MPALDPVSCVHLVTGVVRPVTPDLLAETYLCPRPAPFEVEQAVAEARHAPWAESFAVAPEATQRAVSRALTQLIEATPGLDPAGIRTEGLPPGRARRHLEALCDLWRDIGTLPEHLVPLTHAMACEAGDALEPLPVLPLDARPGATAADLALAALLADHHGVAPDAARHHAAIPGLIPAGRDPALRDLQRSLVAEAPVEGRPPLAVHAVRDPVAELALAAGMAQRFLDDRIVDTPDEIGLLIPEETEWLDGVKDAFAACGLRLAGLPGDAARDTAGEAVHLILTTLRKPAPGMARVALDGLGLRVATDAARAVLESHPSSEREVGAALGALAGLFGGEIGVRLSYLGASMVSDAAPDWDLLLFAARPHLVATDPPARRLGAITVLPAGRVPWRGVRRLIGVGFAGDRYPDTPAASVFWLEHEIEAIEAATGLRLPGRRTGLDLSLARLTRQLSAASDGIDLVLPRRDRSGAPLLPAPAVDLIARRLGTTAKELVRDLPDHPATWPCAARVTPPCPHQGAPHRPEAPELQLARDLTGLRVDADGTVRPQSPSRLERLLVSPLGWVLEELGARDVAWAPDDLDVLVKGSVLHAAFERLFPPGPPRAPDAVRDAASAALDAAIASDVPFLAGPAWTVERAHLLSELKDAAGRWARLLDDAGLEIAATEQALTGTAFDLDIRGFADAILRDASGRPIVIDYKSGGSRTRRTRLEGGWDLQARLYGDMLAAEGPANLPTRPLAGYLGLADGEALVGGGDGPPGFRTVASETHAEAWSRIEAHLAALRSGRVALNRMDDRDWLKAAGIGAYALDHPIVAAFLWEDRT